MWRFFENQVSENNRRFGTIVINATGLSSSETSGSLEEAFGEIQND